MTATHIRLHPAQEVTGSNNNFNYNFFLKLIWEKLA